GAQLRERALKHRAREIAANDEPGAPRSDDRDRLVARSAAEIEDPSRGILGQRLRRAPPPASVLVQAQEVVEEIVAPRDPVEHRPHPTGIAALWGSHDGSIADSRSATSRKGGSDDPSDVRMGALASQGIDLVDPETTLPGPARDVAVLVRDADVGN